MCLPVSQSLDGMRILRSCRWLTIAVGLGITSVLGEWLCLQREMRDIVIGGPHMPADPASADRRMRPTVRWVEGQMYSVPPALPQGGPSGGGEGPAAAAAAQRWCP